MATIVKDSTLVPVYNMVDHKVVYVNSETHRRVVFEPFQKKNIPAGELRTLNYSTGGEKLIHDYLCIKSDDLRAEFNIPSDQIEYDWTLDDIHKVLEDLSTPIEVLQDALDFGPQGIRELIADCAVKWKIPDSNRRRIISQMTGVNIDKQIEFLEKVEEPPIQSDTSSQRRVNRSEPQRTGRRVQS